MLLSWHMTIWYTYLWSPVITAATVAATTAVVAVPFHRQATTVGVVHGHGRP